MDEKLRWIFNLYDLNRDGKVTKDELILVVTSIYDLMGKYTNPAIDEATPRQHAETVFKVIYSHTLSISCYVSSISSIFFYYLEIQSKTRWHNYNGGFYKYLL